MSVLQGANPCLIILQSTVLVTGLTHNQEYVGSNPASVTILNNKYTMKKITIAFDCDGTLIQSDDTSILRWNKEVVDLLILLSKFKNTKIVVWSWRWKDWAKETVEYLDIRKYVDRIESKNHIWKDAEWKHQFAPDFVPDIAIDDIQECDLWVLNLIVKQK